LCRLAPSPTIAWAPHCFAAIAMFSTSPAAQSTHPMAFGDFAVESPSAMLLGMLQRSKSSNASVASTRATSPSSSSGDAASSEDASAALYRKQPEPPTSDIDNLARRRGRSVLALSELVIDHGLEGSPSEESTSSMRMARGYASVCTPCTPNMMGFSPPTGIAGNGLAPVTGVCTNQMPDNTMMSTMPMQKSMDASQRSQAADSRSTGPLDAAGRDASQRIPCCVASATGANVAHPSSVGKVSLGGAAVGGDASQRSPPGCTKQGAEGRPAHFCNVAQPLQQNALPLQGSSAYPPNGSPPPISSRALEISTSPKSDFQVLLDMATASGNQKAIDALMRQAQKLGGAAPQSSISATVPEVSSPASSRSASSGDASQRSPAATTTQGIIAGTLPDAVAQASSRAFSVGDASQRSPDGSLHSNFVVDGRSDTVKSWLLGASSNGFPVNDALIAEQLYAAVPEIYED